MAQYKVLASARGLMGAHAHFQIYFLYIFVYRRMNKYVIHANITVYAVAQFVQFEACSLVQAILKCQMN